MQFWFFISFISYRYSINQNAIFIHYFLLTTPKVGANESNVGTGTLINQKTKWYDLITRLLFMWWLHNSFWNAMIVNKWVQLVNQLLLFTNSSCMRFLLLLRVDWGSSELLQQPADILMSDNVNFLKITAYLIPEFL
jgi:hypothetical protein